MQSFDKIYIFQVFIFLIMKDSKKPLSWFDKIIFKRVSVLWLVAAVIFWLLAAIAIVCIMIVGVEFYNYQAYLDRGNHECAEYCETRGEPFFLFDHDAQACQCYNDAEEPTDFKNLRSGFERDV